MELLKINKKKPGDTFSSTNMLHVSILKEKRKEKAAICGVNLNIRKKDKNFMIFVA